MNIKTEKDIEKEIITDFMATQNRVTYFGSGSVIRALFRAIARRLGELWYDYGQKIKMLFLSTATGDDLNAYGLERGVTRFGAIGSQALLVFKGLSGTVIPELTQVTGDHGYIFETQNAITINTDGGYQFGSEGLGAVVQAQCTATGAATNVAENTINKLVVAIPDVDSVSNPLPAHYGADNESDEEYRYRIKNQIGILNKSTTAFIKEACIAAIPEINRIFVEKAAGQYAINIYALTRTNTYLNTAQKAYIKKYLNDYWMVLPQVNILDLPTIDVNVYMRVRPVSGYTLSDVFIGIADDLIKYLDFRTWVLGEDVDSDDILQICLNNSMVDDIEISTFEPMDDIVIPYNSLPILSNITMVHLDNASITINLDLHPSY